MQSASMVIFAIAALQLVNTIIDDISNYITSNVFANGNVNLLTGARKGRDVYKTT